MSKQLLLQDGAEFCDSSSLLAAPNSYDILLSMGRSEISNSTTLTIEGSVAVESIWSKLDEERLKKHRNDD